MSGRREFLTPPELMDLYGHWSGSNQQGECDVATFATVELLRAVGSAYLSEIEDQPALEPVPPPPLLNAASQTPSASCPGSLVPPGILEGALEALLSSRAPRPAKPPLVPGLPNSASQTPFAQGIAPRSVSDSLNESEVIPPSIDSATLLAALNIAGALPTTVFVGPSPWAFAPTAVATAAAAPALGTVLSPSLPSDGPSIKTLAAPWGVRMGGGPLLLPGASSANPLTLTQCGRTAALPLPPAEDAFGGTGSSRSSSSTRPPSGPASSAALSPPSPSSASSSSSASFTAEPEPAAEFPPHFALALGAVPARRLPPPAPPPQFEPGAPLARGSGLSRLPSPLGPPPPHVLVRPLSGTPAGLPPELPRALGARVPSAQQLLLPPSQRPSKGQCRTPSGAAPVPMLAPAASQFAGVAAPVFDRRGLASPSCASVSGRSGGVVPTKGATRTTAEQLFDLPKDQIHNPRKVFVGGISHLTTEDTLRARFQRFNPVAECEIVRHRKSGRSRGFAFVTFVDREGAILAANANRHCIDGVVVECREARPRERPVPTVTAAAAVPPTKVFVGGLPPAAAREDVQEFFVRFGTIEQTVLCYDRQANNRSRGFGFVVFAEAAAAERAIGKHWFQGRCIEVKYAVPRQNDRKGHHTASRNAAACIDRSGV